MSESISAVYSYLKESVSGLGKRLFSTAYPSTHLNPEQAEVSESVQSSHDSESIFSIDNSNESDRDNQLLIQPTLPSKRLKKMSEMSKILSSDNDS